MPDRRVKSVAVKADISETGSITGYAATFTREPDYVGDYRILCTFDGDELIVLAIEVEHRSEVYKHRKDKRRR